MVENVSGLAGFAQAFLRAVIVEAIVSLVLSGYVWASP